MDVRRSDKARPDFDIAVAVINVLAVLAPPRLSVLHVLAPPGLLGRLQVFLHNLDEQNFLSFE